MSTQLFFKVSGHLAWLKTTKFAGCQMGYCILKTVCKNTQYVRSPSLILAAFPIWSKMRLYSFALLLPWSMLSVRERLSTQSLNFVVKTSSHVTFECSTCCEKLMMNAIDFNFFFYTRFVKFFIFVCKVITSIKEQQQSEQ